MHGAGAECGGHEDGTWLINQKGKYSVFRSTQKNTTLAEGGVTSFGALLSCKHGLMLPLVR
jgi:hypothetical protein